MDVDSSLDAEYGTSVLNPAPSLDSATHSSAPAGVPSGLRVRLRRTRLPNGQALPDFVAVLPSGESVVYAGYEPGQKRPRGSSKKSAARPSMSESFAPGTPQYTFWRGVENVWDLLEIPMSGERALVLLPFLMYYRWCLAEHRPQHARRR